MPVAGLIPGTSTLIWRAPRATDNACPNAVVTQPCADGYSGWLGVGASSGSQVGSVPARTAWTGRQKEYVYLASQHAMDASLMVMLPIASSRAAASAPIPCWVATARNVR